MTTHKTIFIEFDLRLPGNGHCGAWRWAVKVGNDFPAWRSVREAIFAVVSCEDIMAGALEVVGPSVKRSTVGISPAVASGHV